jgi:two-component system sensor histidine kinase DesK
VGSRIQPDRRAIFLLSVIGAVCAVAMTIGGVDVGSAAIQGLSVSLIGFAVFSIGTLQRTNAQLLAARDEIGRLAVAEERARIARDLHDTLGHSLSVIALKSELAGRLLPGSPERAKEEIGDIERVSREALASVRETVSGFRRPTLDSELAEVRSSLAAAGVDVRVERTPAALPPAVESVIAWTVREGGTNILRHSSAARATIRIGREDGAATAEIEDEGPSAPDRAASSAGEDAAAGSGLAGLAERVEAQGGRFLAGPTPTGGFRVSVRVPVESVPE